MSKICRTCQLAKPVTEYGKNKAAKDGLDYLCKPCKKTKNIEDRAKRTPEQVEKANVRAKQFRLDNPDSVQAYRETAKPEKAAKARLKYIEDTEYREKTKAAAREYRVNNPEKVKDANQSWRADNIDHAREYARDYARDRRANDPEFHQRSLDAQTRWRLKNWRKDELGNGWIKGQGRGEELPTNLIPRLHAWQDDCCYFCNKPFNRAVHDKHPDADTFEHILPRDRGGPTISKNLALTCYSCNSTRQAKIFHQEWKPPVVQIVSDKLTLRYAKNERILEKAGLGGRLDLTTGAHILESAAREPKMLFIVSTFWGSERNPGSHKGRYIDVLQKAYPNSIQLLDHEWYGRQTAVLNMLKSKMGISDKTLGARSLSLVEISHKVACQFLDEFHLMGKVIAKHRFGLVSDTGDLYGVGLFDEVEGSYDCKRLAFRGHVPGGMSKIMKHARTKFGGAVISSFVDSRYASGVGHETIGFKHIGRTDPVYYWVFPDRVKHHRYLSNDAKMAQNLLYFNPGASNSDNITANGVYKIWLPGRYKMEWVG